MRLLYLGELVASSYIVEVLYRSGMFERVDHFTRLTLGVVYPDVEPRPDVILLKCDNEAKELEWAKHYFDVNIPMIFVMCDLCKSKEHKYKEYGYVFDFEAAMNKKDLELDSLIDFIVGIGNH
jgi:hypothetical protein